MAQTTLNGLVLRQPKPNPEDIDHTITKRTITLTVCSTQTSGFTNTEMDSIPDKHCFALLAS